LLKKSSVSTKDLERERQESMYLLLL
jgi:hypothetical protein